MADALDECMNSAPLFDMLAKLNALLPLRILLISREALDFQTDFLSLSSHQTQTERISISDTLPDIKILVESKAKTFIMKDDNDRAALMEKILEKSRGSFLWTILVLTKLSNS